MVHLNTTCVTFKYFSFYKENRQIIQNNNAGHIHLIIFSSLYHLANKCPNVRYFCQLLYAGQIPTTCRANHLHSRPQSWWWRLDCCLLYLCHLCLLLQLKVFSRNWLGRLENILSKIVKCCQFHWNQNNDKRVQNSFLP